MSDKPTPPDPGHSARPRSDEDRDRALQRLERALAESLARSHSFEAQLADQRQRLEALGTGREETMRALAEARDELRRIKTERDELRQRLARVDSVQTATIALSEDDVRPLTPPDKLASLEDLMAALGNIAEPSSVPDSHPQQRVQNAPDLSASEEMISPALVFPEEFAATAGQDGADASRVLVLLDAERPVKYPLFKEVMTIGRADIADIQINNGFLSRLHARIVTTRNGVVIEDVESKNGIRVNAKQTERQALHHGDVVDLGRLRFRYIDTAADDPP
jgi:transposase-like protein